MEAIKSTFNNFNFIINSFKPCQVNWIYSMVYKSIGLNNLIRLGIGKAKAWEFANTRKNYWHVANSPILSTTFTNEYLKKLGLVSIVERYLIVH